MLGGSNSVRRAADTYTGAPSTMALLKCFLPSVHGLLAWAGCLYDSYCCCFWQWRQERSIRVLIWVKQSQGGRKEGRRLPHPHTPFWEPCKIAGTYWACRRVATSFFFHSRIPPIQEEHFQCRQENLHLHENRHNLAKAFCCKRASNNGVLDGHHATCFITFGNPTSFKAVSTLFFPYF